MPPEAPVTSAVCPAPGLLSAMAGPNLLLFQDLLQPVVAGGHARLHAGPEHAVARFLRLVEQRLRQRGAAAALDERHRAHRLAGIPRLVEYLGGDDALVGHDLAVHAAHAHLEAVALALPHVAVLSA